MLRRAFVVIYHLFPFLWFFITHHKRFILFGSTISIDYQKHLEKARSLTEKIAFLGPTFIKLAQILSARADLLPDVYIHELSKLQDRVPPVDTAAIKEVIKNDLKKPIEEIFDYFSEEALAAASLGQVHRATYKGQEVIVKVLRPGVEEMVELDLKILKFMMRMINTLVESHHLKVLINVIEEFSRIIRQEMDFLLEADNAVRFRENFQGNDVIIIPEVIHQVNTKRVLVLKHYQGTRIDELDQIKEKIDIDLTIHKLIRIYGQQVLLDGFFHADPHPGNILVDEAGRIILLDFGMVVTIDREVRKELVRTAIALAKRDYDRLIEGYYRLNIIDAEVNFATVRDATETLIKVFEQDNLSRKRMRDVAFEVFHIFYQFPLKLPSNLVYLFKSALLVEGIGIKYDPTFNGIRGATPVIREMMSELLREEARDPWKKILDEFDELLQFYSEAKRAIKRIDREEWKIRIHPHDINGVEFFLNRLITKMMLSVFAFALSVVVTMFYVTKGNFLIWLLGITFSAFILLVAFLTPSKGRFQPERSLLGYFRKGVSDASVRNFKSL